jgi:DNA-binding beta-propeller fold protein YncE
LGPGTKNPKASAHLTLLRLIHDHFGNFSTALDGVNTPELQIADNDYSVGRVIERIAHSKFKDSTLIFVIEDDAQDGPDHVDAHRSTAFVVGPYVKQNFVDSTRYNTVSMLRTIEDILGTEHLNLNDASALPMANVFDTDQKEWNYKARASAALKVTTLPIPANAYAPQASASLQPLHGAAWWASRTKGMNFSVEDHLDSGKFNRVLWTGTMGNRPYPTARTGLDLSGNRQQLLQDFRAGQVQTNHENDAKEGGASTHPSTGGN